MGHPDFVTASQREPPATDFFPAFKGAPPAGSETGKPTLCKKRKGWATLISCQPQRVRHPRSVPGFRLRERNCDSAHCGLLIGAVRLVVVSLSAEQWATAGVWAQVGVLVVTAVFVWL